MPSHPNDSPEFAPLAHADQTSAQQQPFQPSISDWEAVSLPGMLPVENIPIASEGNANLASSPHRESELKTQIRDLERCNETLLARINQLEDSLEKAHQALQQEVERSQHHSEAEKMTIAQQHSVAQLLSELEESDAALKRQTVLAETLQAQLETYQERSRQLEKECTILRKQQAEKTQQLQATEETCCDLRARLQRQQRYTLQFKVALEKSLDTSTFNHAPATTSRAELDRTPLLETTTAPNPLAMPRSERIRPWSATASGGQADPQLLSLMRSLNDPTSSTLPPPHPLSAPSEATISSPEPIVDKEAEKQLWQDVERVIENSASEVESDPSQAANTIHEAPQVEEVQFTEPMPWGAPVPKEPQIVTIATSPPPVETTVDAIAADITPNLQRPDNEADGTHKARRVDSAPPLPNPSLKPDIPALETAKVSQTGPSPIVHPLRPPTRKRKSLSAVELPSFPPYQRRRGRGIPNSELRIHPITFSLLTAIAIAV